MRRRKDWWASSAASPCNVGSVLKNISRPERFVSDLMNSLRATLPESVRLVSAASASAWISG